MATSKRSKLVEQHQVRVSRWRRREQEQARLPTFPATCAALRTHTRARQRALCAQPCMEIDQIWRKKLSCKQQVIYAEHCLPWGDEDTQICKFLSKKESDVMWTNRWKKVSRCLSGRHFVRTALDVLWIFDFFYWSAPKMAMCHTLRKFWHLEPFWRDLHVIWHIF